MYSMKQFFKFLTYLQYVKFYRTALCALRRDTVRTVSLRSAQRQCTLQVQWLSAYRTVFDLAA